MAIKRIMTIPYYPLASDSGILIQDINRFTHEYRFKFIISLKCFWYCTLLLRGKWGIALFKANIPHNVESARRFIGMDELPFVNFIDKFNALEVISLRRDKN